MDYDINFSNGSAISITIDPTTDDTCDISFDKGLATFSLGEKPSYVDPDKPIPAESVMIPLGNVLCIRKRSRAIEDEPLGAPEEWQRMLQELANPEQDNIAH